LGTTLGVNSPTPAPLLLAARAPGGSVPPSASSIPRDSLAGDPAPGPPLPAWLHSSGATAAGRACAGTSTAARSGSGSANRPAGSPAQTLSPVPSGLRPTPAPRGRAGSGRCRGTG